MSSCVSICHNQMILPYSKAACLFGITNCMSKQTNFKYYKLEKL